MLTWIITAAVAVMVVGCAAICRERTINSVALKAMDAATPDDRKHQLQVLQTITERSPNRQLVLHLPLRRHSGSDPPEDPAGTSAG